MNWALLVLRYIQALIWPLVTIALVFGFRSQVAAMLGRVIEFSGGGLRVKLRQEAAEAEELAEALPDEIETQYLPPEIAPPDASAVAEQPDVPTSGAYVRRHGAWAPLSGVEGILRVWQSVEAAAHQLGDLLGLSGQQSRNVTRVVREANARGLVSDVAVELTSSMQRMRNQIVHSDIELTLGTADSIMRSMALVYATLQTIVGTELDRISKSDAARDDENDAP